MAKQTTESSVVCDHWDWPPSSDLAFFRRLFGDRPFQFELGLKRTERDWFSFSKERGVAVLQERSAFLLGKPPRGVFWTPAAEPIFTELAERFGPFFQTIASKPGGPAAAVELSRQWPPDFILLHRNGESEFRMVGGMVCFPSGWAPEEKMGQPMSQIHEPVPGLNGMLGTRIDTFLGRLTPLNSFDRLNWGFAPHPDRNRHPLNRMPSFTPEFPMEKAGLRVEHQSFHALPQTGGIVFLIHLTIHSVGELVSDFQVASGMARQLQTMSEEVAKYKGLAAVREPWVRWLISRCGSLEQAM